MKQWIPLIATLVAIGALWWNISITVAAKEDIRMFKSEINSRLDRIESRMGTIEQNYLHHITRLHVQSEQSTSQ